MNFVATRYVFPLQCFQSEVVKMYKGMYMADKLQTEQGSCITTKKPCWIPQIINFIPKNIEMDMCTEIEDYDCMIHIFMKIKFSGLPICEKHCEENTYKVSKSQTPIPESILVRK